MNYTRTQMQQAFKDGLLIGRTAALSEATALAILDQLGDGLTTKAPSDNGVRERTDRLVKAAKAPTEHKAPVIARGVKRTSGPREKGVKKAIVELIANEGINGGITTGGIVAKLGFKASSVNATLMGLKKSGIAMQAGKFWVPAPYSDSGNSEAAAQY